MRPALVLALLVAAPAACSSFAESGGSEPASTDAGTTTDGAIATGDGATESGPSSPDATAPLDPTLVAWWRFDEPSGTTAEDAVGSNDGKLVAPASRGAGHAGGALATNKTGRVEVPFHPTLDVGAAFTVAMWVDLDDVANDSWLYVQGYAFYFKLNGRRPQIAVGGGYANTTYELPAGQWHHLAASYAAGVAKLYVDGAALPHREDTFKPEHAPAPNGDPIQIGCSLDLTNCASGLVDDVRLWRRVLTDAEIAAIAKQ